MRAGRTAHSGSMTSSAPNPDSGPSTKSISTVMPGSTCARERNRNDRAARDVFDRVLVSPGHHGLELLSHRDDPSQLPAVHDRLLERGEDAARMTTTTRSSRAYVLAFIGPRPQCSRRIATMLVEIRPVTRVVPGQLPAPLVRVEKPRSRIHHPLRGLTSSDRRGKASIGLPAHRASPRSRRRT